mgnify:CR=1 FL=1
MRIIFASKFSGRSEDLEIPNDITIKELKYEYLERIGFSPHCHLFHRGILNDDAEISTYGIKNGDRIYVEDEYEKMYIQKIESSMEREKAERLKNSTHLCPYGCGRQIPDKYKGCSELLQAEPNYFG